ncbi:MAG TPA: type II toxin-antitoxin system HicB family antitoxin [Ktedonobacterales bacterium]|jgi:predicted RNase H-like HicB family nuclease|nr:type II toxin-antitoxin system HicB family antitoxin [Ktedonobacterales bacterium]
MNDAHYSMLIEWSVEDQAFLVSFPDWAPYVAQPVTHGDTYAEAVRKGQDVLENLIATARNEGAPLPEAKGHVA